MNDPTIITDSLGRKLEVRRLNKLEIRQFTRRMGAACDVDRWFGEAIIAAQVQAIDGTPVPKSLTPDDIDAVVAQLDDPGIGAVIEWARETFPTPQKIAEAAKNSAGTPASETSSGS